jgi:HD-like signal output (HDOD) protein
VVLADSARTALGHLAQRPFDLVVSDLYMPGMPGDQLLHQVRERFPQTVRILLSSDDDDSVVLRALGDSHQYLGKPFDLGILLDTLQRIRNVEQRLSRPEVRRIVGQINQLPSVPEVFFKILRLLNSPDTSTDEIGEVVDTDPALTAQMLRLTNSALLGISRQVTSASEAVGLLGMARVRALVLSIKLFSAFICPGHAFSVDAIWRHSLKVGWTARWIAELEGAGEAQKEEALSAGLLHDVGKLVFAANFTADYQKMHELSGTDGRTLCALEQEVFGATHADVGACLLGIWGLPATLIEAVACHHDPALSGSARFNSLVAVYAANCLVHERAETKPPGSDWQMDMKLMETLGLADRVDEWRAHVVTDA